jgi:excisionase family DNA binding protein
MAIDKNIDPMLTASDVARLLNVHMNTVRRWSNQGVLKAYRIGSRGDRRFRQEDIAYFLSQENNTASSKRRVPVWRTMIGNRLI